MTPIRLGFVGLSSKGWASNMLAPPLFQTPLSSKYQIVAVSTTNPDSAVSTAEKYSRLASEMVDTHTSAIQNDDNVKIKAYHGSTKHISSDPDVDMVVVSIKTMMHKEAALDAIEGGKDLFLQWPAGRNAKETKEIYDAAKRKGVKTLVGTQLREASFVKKVCQRRSHKVIIRSE
jgi:predicted dehydrogenase